MFYCHCTNTFPSFRSHSLAHTQSMSACAGRCLLSTFQYEHHNTLSCCHPFSCHKPTRASSFYSWMLGDTNHMNFPTNWNVFMEGYIYIERESEWVGLHFVILIFVEIGVNIWPLPRRINGGQVGGQTSIFHRHFALGSHMCLNISSIACSGILKHCHSFTDESGWLTIQQLVWHK